MTSITMLRERTVGNGVLGMALGRFASAFARKEFQAVQFLPAVVFPQLLLCGLFVTREQMAKLLTVVFDALLAPRSGR